MPVVRNGAEAYQDDQLVVQAEHAGLVTEELRRLGIAASTLDVSGRLGLALLSMAGVATAAGVLRQDSGGAMPAGPPGRGEGTGAAGTSDLDVVLSTLRRRIASEHDGWVATFGKNRVLGRVQGSPYIKGGVGVPAPAGPVAIGPAGQQPGPRVAMLDTRLYAHPGLIGRFLGDSVSAFGSQPRSTQGHSAFVAGLIARRAPAAQLIASTVLDDDGENASSWAVATAMAGLLDAGADVLNLSLGCVTADRQAPLCLRRAVDLLAGSVVVVAAAGNNGMPDEMAVAAGLTAATPVYPAAIDGVVAVGAYDAADGSGQPAAFSPDAPWVDLLAPGVRVTSTYLSGQVTLVQRGPDGSLTEAGSADFGQPGYAVWDGTSFAAAAVTGAIAALMTGRRVSGHEAVGMLRDPSSSSRAVGDVLPHGPG
jgi:Subtilase family